MRRLLALFAFIALAMAPLGMSAEARTADEHCTAMAGMDHGSPSAEPDKAAVKSCCTAMAAALPAAAEVEQAPTLRAPASALILPLQHGLRRKVEVPPPRG